MITQEQFDAAYNNTGVVYPTDCDRICAVAQRDIGITITPSQAQRIWEIHSDNYSAGWLHIFNDAEIVQAIESFIEGHKP